MAQVWLRVPQFPALGQDREDFAIRADYISSLYAIRHRQAPRGQGRPWRLEATVLGLPEPVVLATAPDRPGDVEGAFRGAVLFLQSEIASELARHQPGIHDSTADIGEFDTEDPDGQLPVEWARFP